MNNMAPEGWVEEAIGKYVDESVAGEWGTESEGGENDIPVLRATNFSLSGAIDYSKLAIRSIPEVKRAKKALKRGDIVLEKSGGSPTQPVGRVIYFDNDKPFLYSNFTQKLSPSGSCNSKYLFYKLYYEYNKGTVFKFQQQTTGIINFQLAEYLLYKTIFPPLPEQQKIAIILTSVDEVIEKTQAQIDKLKDLKTAMMQELLTKGIGHVEFKDSPVGRIPVGWDVVPLATLSIKISDGIHSTPKYTNQSGYSFINGNNLKNGRVIVGNNTKSVSYEEYKKHKKDLGNNTILMSINGTIGNLALYDSEEVVLGKSAAFISLKEEQSRAFIYYALQSETVKKFYELELTGSTIRNLSLRAIKETPLAMPPVHEQNEIALILNSIDINIKLKAEKLVSLLNNKKALMQDLLTGKVRVKIEQPDTELAAT